MSMEEEIKTRVEKAFEPVHLEVINESHKHAGHAGDNGSGESHFKLIIVSALFEGVSRIDRQRLVNKEIFSLFDGYLHALSLKLYTQKEFSSM